MLNSLKTMLSETIGLSKDALHVHLGLFVFLVAVVLLRASPGSWIPWLVLLAFEVLNEVVDLLHEHGGVRALDFVEAAKDIINTMLWPTLVVLFVRYRSRRSESRAATDETVSRSLTRQREVPPGS